MKMVTYGIGRHLDNRKRRHSDNTHKSRHFENRVFENLECFKKVDIFISNQIFVQNLPIRVQSAIFCFIQAVVEKSDLFVLHNVFRHLHILKTTQCRKN